jgi:protein FrlC
MKIRKGAICRYTGALGLEVLDRRYVFAPEAAMKQAMDWYKERI